MKKQTKLLIKVLSVWLLGTIVICFTVMAFAYSLNDYGVSYLFEAFLISIGSGLWAIFCVNWYLQEWG